ncbi:hypothetical protein HBN71_21500 [Pseudomonas lundensis]|uniref:hypothetical protein n=1 Tax=Pseudomonas TaxID=286 RepID=UPI00069B3D28|nr:MULTISPECIES: hypothetical protein [Pseudomonas]NNA13721.1 hypothetical protein [Pseudomonas lundensis]
MAIEPPRFGMVNRHGLIDELKSYFHRDGSLIELEDVKQCVSSPRLFDLMVRQLPIEGLVHVGDTFLDKRTMLADWPQRTYGISLHGWISIHERVELVDVFHMNDASVSKVQVWPFDPASLGEAEMRLAMALSYTAAELYAEPRIVGSLNDVINELGFWVDPERY